MRWPTSCFFCLHFVLRFVIFSLVLQSSAAQSSSSAQSNGVLTTSSQSSGTQSTGQTSTPQAEPIPTRDDVLRGGWGPYRANNRLLYYHLDVRVDPDKKFLSGKNTIRFRMLQDGTRVQIDLNSKLAVDKILLGSNALKYQREDLKDQGPELAGLRERRRSVRRTLRISDSEKVCRNHETAASSPYSNTQKIV